MAKRILYFIWLKIKELSLGIIVGSVLGIIYWFLGNFISRSLHLIIGMILLVIGGYGIGRYGFDVKEWIKLNWEEAEYLSKRRII